MPVKATSPLEALETNLANSEAKSEYQTVHICGKHESTGFAF